MIEEILLFGGFLYAPKTAVYHYSESWAKGNARKNDMILRILRILTKY
jgi:hypothetical protein